MFWKIETDIYCVIIEEVFRDEFQEIRGGGGEGGG